MRHREGTRWTLLNRLSVVLICTRSGRIMLPMSSSFHCLKNDSMFCATRFCCYLTPPPCLPIRPRLVPCPRLLWPLHPLADMTFPPDPSPPRRSTSHGARTWRADVALATRGHVPPPKAQSTAVAVRHDPHLDTPGGRCRAVTATARRRRRGRVEMSAWRWRTVDGICGTRLFGSSSLI